MSTTKNTVRPRPANLPAINIMTPDQLRGEVMRLAGNADALQAQNTALAARVARLEGAFNAGHHALIDQALKGAATALPVLFTMCTKLGFREGATVADEINANVLTAIKQFGHIRAALSPQAEKLEKEPAP